MVGWSPQCYITSFVKVGLPVLEKKIFKYGRGGNLGHVTSIISLDFHFLVPESFQCLRKSSLKICMYTTLGQGQVMTLTFITHISSYIFK